MEKIEKKMWFKPFLIPYAENHSLGRKRMRPDVRGKMSPHTGVEWGTKGLPVGLHNIPEFLLRLTYR
jgi:hypothetical protein